MVQISPIIISVLLAGVAYSAPATEKNTKDIYLDVYGPFDTWVCAVSSFAYVRKVLYERHFVHSFVPLKNESLTQRTLDGYQTD